MTDVFVGEGIGSPHPIDRTVTKEEMLKDGVFSAYSLHDQLVMADNEPLSEKADVLRNRLREISREIEALYYAVNLKHPVGAVTAITLEILSQSDEYLSHARAKLVKVRDNLALAEEALNAWH